MNLTEKASYIKGLAEGLALAANKPEAKIIEKMIELIEDMSRVISNIEEDVEYLGDYIEEIDDDLAVVEDEVYGIEDDDDFECDGDCCNCDLEDCMEEEECIEIVCPSCGETVCFDPDIDPDNFICPACQEKIEVDFVEDDEE